MNAFPNCMIDGHVDEVKTAKTPSGYELIYQIDSPDRVLEWIISKPMQS